MRQISPKIASLIFSVLVICFVMAFYALGWTEPSTDAPAVNVYAPINASSIEQRKLGTLRIAGLTADGETHLSWDSGSVGIGTTTPDAGYKLDVEGNIQANAFDTGDITFRDQETNQILWRMFEDEDGLYLENARTEKVYKFVLEEIGD